MKIRSSILVVILLVFGSSLQSGAAEAGEPRSTGTNPVDTISGTSSTILKGDLINQIPLLETKIMPFYRSDGSGSNLVCGSAATLSLPIPEGGFVDGYNIMDNVFRVYFRLPSADGKLKGHHMDFRLPEYIVNAFGKGTPSLEDCLLQYQQQKLVFENGKACLPLPGETPLYALSSKGDEFKAITAFPYKGIVAAIVWKDGFENSELMGIDVATAKVTWKFPMPSIEATQRLTWIDGRYILATLYGRKVSLFAIIDIDQKKVISQGAGKAGTTYMIIGNKVIEYTDVFTKSKYIFSLDKAK